MRYWYLYGSIPNANHSLFYKHTIKCNSLENPRAFTVCTYLYGFVYYNTTHSEVHCNKYTGLAATSVTDLSTSRNIAHASEAEVLFRKTPLVYFISIQAERYISYCKCVLWRAYRVLNVRVTRFMRDTGQARTLYYPFPFPLRHRQFDNHFVISRNCNLHRKLIDFLSMGYR